MLKKRLSDWLRRAAAGSETPFDEALVECYHAFLTAILEARTEADFIRCGLLLEWLLGPLRKAAEVRSVDWDDLRHELAQYKTRDAAERC